MVRHPFEYAEMLKQRMLKHGANVWLVNTGWVGGRFGVGKRISIRHTRNLLNAALEGKLETVKYRTDKLFGYEVPMTCPEVPEDVLYPENSWEAKMNTGRSMTLLQHVSAKISSYSKKVVHKM